MALSRGLALWLYPAALQATPPQGLRDYRNVATSLDFTTVSPGGYGTLDADLNLSAKYLARPELQLFAICVLTARGAPIFIGEIAEISLHGSGVEETIHIQALGAGNCLRDDPANFAYVNQTIKQIMTDQFTNGAYQRTTHNYPISFDLAQVFPDNPATQYSPSYANRNIEEILNDLCILAGGYTWGVWEHPITRDAVGFPVGRLEAHIRDFTTTHYVASIQQREVTDYSVTQSAERAYNVVSVDFSESSGAPGFATTSDPRLGTGGVINLAPFRFRKYLRGLTGTSTATTANAQVIANTLLAQYKNGGNKVDLTLSAIRDYNGAALPLWDVRADRNIFLPDFSGRGVSGASQAVATVNQFYILQTTYSEVMGSGATLKLTCDNYTNSIDVIMARLQYMAERAARTGSKTTEMVQALGATLKGWANGSDVAAAGAQAFSLQGTSFRPILALAPASISWATAAYQVNNTGAPTVNNITQYGFNAFVTSTGAGAVTYGGAYTTVGNCIYLSDAKRGLFDHHCEQCGETTTGRSLKADICVEYDAVGTPAMSVNCASCGARECFNLNLALSDERMDEHNHPQRAEQAQHIRAIMRHAHVGLHQHVRA